MGPIAQAENLLMLRASGLMLVVVIPVIVLTLGFAWRYRAGNDSAAYRPDWDRSRLVEAVVWGIPILMIAALGTMVWDKTHALDPYKPLPGGAATRVQAISLDWKWLFVYPDLGIASVNELAFPADLPVSFQITSDVALNSFIIPDLGGQIYAMAGMETQLNLKADAPGRLEGRNMQFSGEGFPEQSFDVLAMTENDFSAWVRRTRASGTGLDAQSFADLSKPSIDAPVAHFATVSEGFFAMVLARHMATPHAPLSHTDRSSD